MQALEEKRYSQNSRILEPEAFESLVQAYMKAKLKNLVECVLIKVDVQNSEYQKTDEQMSGTVITWECCLMEICMSCLPTQPERVLLLYRTDLRRMAIKQNTWR